MNKPPAIVVVVVLTALVFDFTNGFHDTANAMATSIATGALRPKVAVTVAGCLNLVGAFLSVEELRQVVPVSDIRGRLGAGPARCRMAGGYWLPTGAAGSSGSRCEPSNALLPPAARTRGERLDCQHARRIHLPASKAGPRPTRSRPFTGSARPFTILQHAAQTATPP